MSRNGTQNAQKDALAPQKTIKKNVFIGKEKKGKKERKKSFFLIKNYFEVIKFMLMWWIFKNRV